MRTSDVEILSQIRRLQADLSPVLPPELAMTGEDEAAVRIRLQVLRAKLEFPPEQEETPLPLTHLLALLTELVGYAEGSEQADDANGALLRAMRGAILTGDATVLRNALAPTGR